MRFSSTFAPTAMVASADHLATRAGLDVLARGGNAVDAALATNAVLAVTSPHLCGMGGDLFALVHERPGPPDVLNASGPPGAGADADGLRREGHRVMPFRDDIRSVTVPGCVDGWAALHAKYATVPLAELFRPAIDYAERGFPAAPLLCGAVTILPTTDRWAVELREQAGRPGDLVRRPGLGRALRAIAAEGRDGFYRGEFGEGLLELGQGFFSAIDLAIDNAEFVRPLGIEVWGHYLWTVPPNSQGYLTLTGSSIAERVGISGATGPEPDDGQWAHLTVEAGKASAHDRPAVLYERADARALVNPDELARRARAIDPDRAAELPASTVDGDTTYLCVVDGSGMGVSLIQSNAGGFGSHLFEPRTGINLHNRGIGFSLLADHPAEFRSNRRPPHTLSPALATQINGELAAVFGTMGGDAQPQLLLQIAARLFAHGQSVGQAIAAPRWSLRGPDNAFDTWTSGQAPTVELEAGAPDGWATHLAARGHRIAVDRTGSAFGHAHAIVVDPNGVLEGSADPRCLTGAAQGF